MPQQPLHERMDMPLLLFFTGHAPHHRFPNSSRRPLTACLCHKLYLLFASVVHYVAEVSPQGPMVVIVPGGFCSIVIVVIFHVMMAQMVVMVMLVVVMEYDGELVLQSPKPPLGPFLFNLVIQVDRIGGTRTHMKQWSHFRWLPMHVGLRKASLM